MDEEETRRHRLENLTAAVQLQTSMLERIDQRIKARVIFSAVVLVAFVLAGAWLQDQHVQDCSPGAKALKVVDAIRDNRINSRDDFVRVANAHQPWYCDATNPGHAHSDLDDWPTGWNVAGLVVYGGLAVGAFVWVRRSRAHARPAREG